MMRRIAVLTAVLAIAGVALAAQRPAGTASLSGRVVRTDIAAKPPVARAVVSIDAGDGRGERQTVTDDDGRFIFEGLPAGRFLITATKTGWVPSYYGSPRPGRPPGVRIAVSDGARVEVEVPMMQGSVIAGRIVDEEGRPLARQFPRLMEYRMVGDKRMLGRTRFPYSIGSFERATNDLGEFRLFGLPPGTYYLVLVPSITAGARITTADEVRRALQPPGAGRNQVPPQGPTAGYAPVYFPGSTDPAGAAAIVVGPGEVREDLQFTVGYVTVARVEGVAHRPDGAPAAGARVTLDDRVQRVSLEGSARSATADASGRFVFPNVPPGDYRLSARAASPVIDATGAPAPRPAAPTAFDLWGQTDIAVSGNDVQGIGLTLAPASTINGRVVFPSTSVTPPPLMTAIRVQFVRATALAEALASNPGSGSTASGESAMVNADGTFRVSNLPPDRYLAFATWPGMRTGDGNTGWWLSTISVGGRDLADAPIDVRPNEEVTNVSLGFRDRVGTIEGSLSDTAGRPAPEYFVLAFPTERGSWTTTSRRMLPAVRPATDGRFRITGLLAGDYYLAVVASLDADDATDPAFLESILPVALRVTVRDGATVRQDVKVAGR